MGFEKQQRVGKHAYAMGRKFVSKDEESGCQGCAAQQLALGLSGNMDKALVRYRAKLCSQLPECKGVIWEEE